ncbi:MAG TPA: hypothetical protein VFE03_12570, partial [Caulobacteraceae bacterium]|nr:hypothetical protein [Caulobacteraceae bacterium]
GARVVVNRETLAAFARWFALYLPVRAKAAATGLVRPGPRIWFGPDTPRPWYLIWAAAAWSGARIAKNPQEADAAFYFDDVTHGRAPAPLIAKRFNFECQDVSKSRVAAVFEAVFGYPLALDPETHIGVAVEKGEANGAHDGAVVVCPRPRSPGRVYQRLIGNIDRGDAVDLRTPFVGAKPVVVFVKRRPVEERFANHNSSVVLARPDEVFSLAEIAKLSAFARAMKLDWGGLDILRDRADGRLYVVDVNKTDMPPIVLPWRDKLRAVSRLAAALRDLISREETP